MSYRYVPCDQFPAYPGAIDVGHPILAGGGIVIHTPTGMPDESITDAAFSADDVAAVSVADNDWGSYFTNTPDYDVTAGTGAPSSVLTTVGPGRMHPSGYYHRYNKAAGGSRVMFSGDIAMGGTFRYDTLPSQAMLWWRSTDQMLCTFSGGNMNFGVRRGNVTQASTNGPSITAGNVISFLVRSGPDSDVTHRRNLFLVYDHDTDTLTDSTVTETSDDWSAGTQEPWWRHGGSGGVFVQLQSFILNRPSFDDAAAVDFVRRPWQIYHRRERVAHAAVGGGAGTPMNYRFRRAA